MAPLQTSDDAPSTPDCKTTFDTVDTSAGTEGYCIALQPICDTDMRHVGDELLYRNHAGAQSASIHDSQQATARVCHIAFHEVGIDRLVGSRKVFVNMPREWLLRPELLPPYAGKLVIEVLESVKVNAGVLDALHRIRARGYEIALDDFVLSAETRPLLAAADIVKIDARQPVKEQEIALYRAQGLRLLAEKVETLDTFTRLKRLGFELFQGYFYAHPDTLSETSRRRSNNQTALLRLLTELQNEHVDYSTLADLISQDPQTTLALLRYANSALFNRHPGGVLTIQQALNTLGLRQVRIVVLTIMLAAHGPA